MITSRMSAQRIASLLTGDDVAPELLEILKNDSRHSVIKLLEKWERRQASCTQEQQRLTAMMRYEHDFYASGYRLIAGVDEAGRGPLAGPVVIAAVILSPKIKLPGLNDSKKLSAKQREKLYAEIAATAIATSFVVLEADVIDRLNIYQATLKGMYDVLRKLQPTPEVALIDAMPLRELTIPYMAIIDGDALSASIAAASIVAKVERDRIMTKLDAIYPEYGFAKHKGYGTSDHLAALKKCGPCAIHRKSFAPVKTWASLSNAEQQ